MQLSEVKEQLNILIQRIKKIETKINKLLRLISELTNKLEIIDDVLPYLVSIILSERAKEAYRKLEELKNKTERLRECIKKE